MNAVSLMGRLTRDPDVKHSVNGTVVCEFGLAINGRKKRGDEWIDDTTFVDVTAFGRSAELLGQYFSKGSPIALQGRLTTDTWQDQAGNNRQKLKVILERLHFVPKNDRQATRQADRTHHEPAATPAAPEPVDGDDIPF